MDNDCLLIWKYFKIKIFCCKFCWLWWRLVCGFFCGWFVELWEKVIILNGMGGSLIFFGVIFYCWLLFGLLGFLGGIYVLIVNFLKWDMLWWVWLWLSVLFKFCVSECLMFVWIFLILKIWFVEFNGLRFLKEMVLVLVWSGVRFGWFLSVRWVRLCGLLSLSV